MFAPQKKIIIAAGGTGGHLFPAQILAKELSHSLQKDSILFMGGGLAKNPFFEKNAFDFVEVPVSSLSFANPVIMISKSASIFRGIWECYKILRKLKPKLVIGFGSYYSFPTLVAAKLCKIPIVLHEQNSIPGKVNRLFSPFVKVTLVSCPSSIDLLKGKTQLTAFPLRFDFSKKDKKEASQYFALDPEKFTFLILGGSQGAKTINKHASITLPKLVSFLPPFQVIHLIGKNEERFAIQKKWQDAGLSCVIKAFEDRMDHAWGLADFAITRAGASSLAEQIASQTPGIVIPYPLASENHQEKNGTYFVEIIQGGVMIKEEQLNHDNLCNTILMMMNKLEHYQKNLNKNQELGRPTFIEVVKEHLHNE